MNEKKSADGFTQIPNYFLDNIYNSNNIKHKVDAISVITFFIRYLYGNSGTLMLVNEYSLSEICKKLGWGPTNTYRLRRTLNSLEEVGILKTSIKFGNIVVVEINAEVEKTSKKATVVPISNKILVNDTNENTETLEPEESHEEEASVQGLFPPPLRNPSTRSKESLDRSNIINDNKFIKNHYSENNDLEEKANILIELYERSFEAPVTSGHKFRLKEALQGTKISIDVLIRYIKDLAAHPYTRKQTTSINYIFHARFAFTSDGIKNFENVAFEMLNQLAYSELKKAVISQGFCFKTFENYYSEYLQNEEVNQSNYSNEQPSSSEGLNAFTFK